MTLTYLLWRFVLCVHLVRTSAIKASQQLYIWLHYDRFPTIMGGRIIILIRNICVNEIFFSLLCKTTLCRNTQSPSVKHTITGGKHVVDIWENTPCVLHSDVIIGLGLYDILCNPYHALSVIVFLSGRLETHSSSLTQIIVISNLLD